MSTTIKSGSANQAAAQLAQLIRGDNVLTPENVPDGYASLAQLAAACPDRSSRAIGLALEQGMRRGEIERVRVKEPGRRVAYWYRTKRR